MLLKPYRLAVLCCVVSSYFPDPVVVGSENPDPEAERKMTRLK
jgi:hypothetical protein